MRTKEADGIALTATLLITNKVAEQKAYAAIASVISNFAAFAFVAELSSFSLEK